MWKKLSTKDLLKHKRIHVVEDQVELPSGIKTDYIRLIVNGRAPCVIAVNNEGKILIQREYSYPVNEWLYQFPAGMVPEGEDLKEGGVS